MTMEVNELVPKLFEHEKFGKVRVVTIDGEPWPVGIDVATALGYSNPHDHWQNMFPTSSKGSRKSRPPGGYNLFS